ncbi:hypothetical protein V8F20_005388 [Naviculisporaceae sp. PSN 640]
MAEILGIVASGLAVQQTACQLTKSLFRLRQLWEQIQNAPEQIQDLMADIASFTALLSEMEGQLDEDNPSARHSAQHCRNALTQLDAVTSALQLQLTSPKRSKKFAGALKVVLRREDLKRYEDKLDRAFRLLQMSHQCYIYASTSALPDVLAQRMSVELQRYHKERVKSDREGPVTDCIDTDNEQKSSNPEFGNVMVTESRTERASSPRRRFDKTWPVLGGTLVIKSSSHSSSFEISFQPPVLQRIWAIRATQTYGGWKYVFRQGGLMGPKVRAFVESDDEAGLLQIFRSREASPYDRDDWGLSVFQYAAILRKWRVSTMMLKSGYVEDGEVEPPPVDDYDYFPTTFWDLLSGYDSEQIWLLNDLGYHLAWHRSAESKDFIFMAASSLDSEALQVWQRLYYPQYYGLPLEIRCSIGRLLATKPGDKGWITRRLRAPRTEVFKSFISVEWETSPASDLVTHSIECGSALLGSAAYAFGWASALGKNEPDLPSKSIGTNPQSWDSLVRDIVLGAPTVLHPIEDYEIWGRWTFHWRFAGSRVRKLTPLWAALFGAFMAGYRMGHPWAKDSDQDYMYGARPRPEFWDNVAVALRQWLNLLSSCGVDLHEYGRVERNLISKSKVSQDIEINLRIWDTADGLVGWVRVVSLDIGPRPEDWRVWWAFEYEIYAQEFWEMVEETAFELPVPGSWVD